MPNILIVKNNSLTGDLHMHALESFRTGGYRIYNTQGKNEEQIRSIVGDIEKNKRNNEKVLILFVTYNQHNNNEIEDMFIGTDVSIVEGHNIKYFMKVHLTKELQDIAIKNIVGKIDLDISKDFDNQCYVMLSTMKSLYAELLERIYAKKKISLVPKPEKVGPNEMQTYTLSQLAQKDFQSKKLYMTDEVEKAKSQFQLDRESIVNSKAFRRLVDKAQIFGSEKGIYYRTRMTHSLEVNQIAKDISYALRLNIDLTEAIALAHDLGHTPFGHQGERTLDDILSGKIDAGIGMNKEMLMERCFGGFKHNYQSARILTELEQNSIYVPGLNVSVQVVEGVLKHTKFKTDIALTDFLRKEYLEKMNIKEGEKVQICSTLEGQVVAIADEIAQRGHDVDDALNSGVMEIEDFVDQLKVRKCEKLERDIESVLKGIDDSDRVSVNKKGLKIAQLVKCIKRYFIDDAIQTSKNIIERYNMLGTLVQDNSIEMIKLSDEAKLVNEYLERVVNKKVICDREVSRADHNANVIVKTLFQKYYANPRLLEKGPLHRFFVDVLRHEDKDIASSAVNLGDGDPSLIQEEIKVIKTTTLDDAVICEFLSTGMIEEDKKWQVIIFEKRRILIRTIVDYIAGMTDEYALREYEKLK